MVYDGNPLNPEQTEALRKEYYDNNCYFGRDKLFKWMRAKHPELIISKRQINDWLKSQMVHQVLAPKKITKNIKPTILSAPFSQVGIDLFDMQNSEYDEYKYVLVGVDLFSKRGYAVPLKNKQDVTALEGFKELLKQMTEKPHAVRSDNGSEFISDIFKKYLEDEKIKQILSSPGEPQSNGGAERFVQTTKKALRFQMTYSNNMNWPSMLPDVIKKYNESYHSTIKMTPNEGEKANRAEIKDNIIKAVIPKNETTKNAMFPVFAIGDQVRLKIINENNDTAKDFKGINFSRELYKVHQIIVPPIGSQAVNYKVTDANDEVVPKIYYKEDLLLCSAIEHEIQKPETFTVSRILDKRIENGITQLLIKWKHYRKTKDDTWENYDKVKEDVPKMVKKFDEEWEKKNETKTKRAEQAKARKEDNKKKAEEMRIMKQQQEEQDKLAKQAVINARNARAQARSK